MRSVLVKVIYLLVNPISQRKAERPCELGLAMADDRIKLLATKGSK